jgi:very-short-patch-repair endonuclease
LLRLQNVSTKRREKINSDEEERLRLGYELRTSVRFSEHGGGANTTATVEHDGDVAFRLAYGQAATLWRINLGWNRRKDRDVRGFILDKERGYWAKNEILEEGEQEDPMSPQKVRVVPFVEDHRNCLLLQPTQHLDERLMASLQAALKNAIQVHFQLEGMELAAEPLPTAADRRQLLIYEAAEGGAGALRRLVEDPTALAAVARTALEVCHFTPTGEDLGKAPRSQDRCEAACYDCLLSYSNQPDHRRLDRFAIRDVLLNLATSVVNASPVRASRSEHLEKLMRLAGSGLERTWLRHLDARRHRLPSDAQKLLETFGTRPDFLYDGQQTVIYIDGPHHKYPERVARDQQLTDRLEDAGFSVIRFAAEDDWDAILAKFPDIFGTSSTSTKGTRAAPRRFDADLFPDAWQGALGDSAGDGLIVEAGEDVVVGDRVVGTFVAKLTRGKNAIYLIDSSDPDAARVTAALGNAGLRVITTDPSGLRALVAQELPGSA